MLFFLDLEKKTPPFKKQKGTVTRSIYNRPPSTKAKPPTTILTTITAAKMTGIIASIPVTDASSRARFKTAYTETYTSSPIIPTIAEIAEPNTTPPKAMSLPPFNLIVE